MENFRKLGLSEGFIKLIEESKFKEPSEIQEKTIPLAMAGKDIIGGSATGSGKTLAFGASIIEKTEKGKGIQSLILTPTRELAEQVGGVFSKFSRFKHLHVAIVYGGVGIGGRVQIQYTPRRESGGGLYTSCMCVVIRECQLPLGNFSA